MIWETDERRRRAADAGRKKKIVYHELTLFEECETAARRLARTRMSWTTTVDAVYRSEKWTTGVRARANLGRADGET